MRIIAGKFRSLKLQTLKSNQTRPTSGIVKEAIFSSLGSYFDGGVMLDLFAGSGAMGLEAISRGMEFAYMADSNPQAVKIIKENVKNLKVANQTLIWQLDFISVLKKCLALNLKFDLIYLDPPYQKYQADQLLEMIATFDLLKPGGRLVLESGKDAIFKDSYAIMKKTKVKSYGKTQVTFFQKGSR